MSRYGAVAQREEDFDEELESFRAPASCARCCGIDFTWFWKYIQGGDLSPKQKELLRERLKSTAPHSVEYFCVHAESIRQIGYFAFWLQVGVAAIFTHLFVDKDLIVNSDLMDMFGYNNVSYKPISQFAEMLAKRLTCATWHLGLCLVGLQSQSRIHSDGISSFRIFVSSLRCI